MYVRTQKRAYLKSWGNRTPTWVLLLLLPVVVGLPVSCRQETDDHFWAAQAFLEAYQSKDFNEAIRWVADSTRPALRMLETDLTLMTYRWPDSMRLLADVSSQDTLVYLSYLDTIADTLHLLLRQENSQWRIWYDRNDPIHVARSFLQAFHQGQFKAAARYVSPNSLRDLEIAALYYQSWQGPAVQIQSVQVNEQHSKAIVSYREKGNTLVKRISLMKVKGYWKVSFGKEAQWQ